MKHLILTVLTLAAFSTFAEIYEDYEPSEQHVQLTVVAVEPNYLDDYLVKNGDTKKIGLYRRFLRIHVRQR